MAVKTWRYMAGVPATTQSPGRWSKTRSFTLWRARWDLPGPDGVDQIERERDAEDLSVWIETTAFSGLKLRAWGESLTDSAERRDRRAFDPDRLGAFDGSDHRARREGPTFGLSASGSF